MASFTMRLEDKTVTFKMTEMMAALKDFTVPFNLACDKLLDYFSRIVFDDQGIDEKSWKSWEPSTILARLHRTGHYRAEPEREDQILVWTGALRHGFYKEVSPTKMVIGNDVEYFKFAQLDRPMLKLNAHVINVVYRSIFEYVTPIWSR